MRRYLDASVIVPILIPEASTSAVSDLLRKPGTSIIIGDFAAAEVSSAVSRLSRIQHLSQLQAREALQRFDAWRAEIADGVELSSEDLRFADGLVRQFEHRLRAPDAVHVAICWRCELQLVTLDQRLARAALALGVDTEVPA